MCFQGRTTRMEQEASGQGGAHVELHQCALSAEPSLLLGSMHAYNIPQDIIDKLRLCNQSDIELAGDFIELLIKRNNKATHNEPKL